MLVVNLDGLAGMVISFGCLGLILVNPLGFGPFALFGALVLGMIAPFLYLNVMKRKGDLTQAFEQIYHTANETLFRQK